jgi:hypothetical protein
MVSRISASPPPSGPSTLTALLAAVDPEVRAAVTDVDRSLVRLSLAQSPWDRLRSASRMAQALSRIRDAAASQRG